MAVGREPRPLSGSSRLLELLTIELVHGNRLDYRRPVGFCFSMGKTRSTGRVTKYWRCTRCEAVSLYQCRCDHSSGNARVRGKLQRLISAVSILFPMCCHLAGCDMRAGRGPCIRTSSSNRVQQAFDSIYFVFGARSATIFSKRESPRSGSQKGCSFNAP